MNAEKIFNNLNQIKLSIDEHQQEIEKLDQEIGDGDHIFNIQRGINESIELKDQLIGLDPSEVLKQIGMKVMTTVGGSSGALFATLLISMSKKYNYQLTNQKNLASMFTNGVEAMKKRGKADLGEKTMLDVLIPVSIELQKLSNHEDVKYIARRVKEVAKEAVDKAKDTATAVEVAATVKGDTQVAELAKKTKNEIEKTEQKVNEVVEVAKDKISEQKKIIKEKDEILKNELLTQAQKFCEYVKIKNIVKNEENEENKHEENEDVETAKEEVSNILGGLDTSAGNYANFDFSK